MSTGVGEGGDDHMVLDYLAAIEARRSSPSDFPNPDRITDQLATAAMVQPEDDDVLRRQLAASTPGTETNIERLEDGFVANAKEYAARHDVTYQGWLRAGVDPAVLERAGIRPDPD